MGCPLGTSEGQRQRALLDVRGPHTNAQWPCRPGKSITTWRWPSLPLAWPVRADPPSTYRGGRLSMLNLRPANGPRPSASIDPGRPASRRAADRGDLVVALVESDVSGLPQTHRGVSVSWHYVPKVWRDNELKPHRRGHVQSVPRSASQHLIEKQHEVTPSGSRATSRRTGSSGRVRRSRLDQRSAAPFGRGGRVGDGAGRHALLRTRPDLAHAALLRLAHTAVGGGATGRWCTRLHGSPPDQGLPRRHTLAMPTFTDLK